MALYEGGARLLVSLWFLSDVLRNLLQRSQTPGVLPGFVLLLVLCAWVLPRVGCSFLDSPSFCLFAFFRPASSI